MNPTKTLQNQQATSTHVSPLSFQHLVKSNNPSLPSLTGPECRSVHHLSRNFSSLSPLTYHTHHTSPNHLHTPPKTLYNPTKKLIAPISPRHSSSISRNQIPNHHHFFDHSDNWEAPGVFSEKLYERNEAFSGSVNFVSCKIKCAS